MLWTCCGFEMNVYYSDHEPTNSFQKLRLNPRCWTEFMLFSSALYVGHRKRWSSKVRGRLWYNYYQDSGLFHFIPLRCPPTPNLCVAAPSSIPSWFVRMHMQRQIIVQRLGTHPCKVCSATCPQNYVHDFFLKIFQMRWSSWSVRIAVHRTTLFFWNFHVWWSSLSVCITVTVCTG